MVVYPTRARTTLTFETSRCAPSRDPEPGRQSHVYAYTYSGGATDEQPGLSQPRRGRPGKHHDDFLSVGRRGHDGDLPDRVQNAIASYQYRYNSNNQLAAVIDELGNRSSLVWDSFGNRTAVVDPYNQRTTYVYDSMARLIAVENALGFRATQLYDSQGRLAADINPLGFRTSYAYDTNSQLLQVQDPLGHITTTLHDNVNRLTAQIDPLGNRISFTYDVDGRLIRTTNPIGAITTQFLTPIVGWLRSLDALGLRTSYAYDISSNLIRTMNPLGQINTTLYDLACRPITQIDALGNRTSIAYDASWNQIRTDKSAGFYHDQRLRPRESPGGVYRSRAESHERHVRPCRRSDPHDQSARIQHNRGLRQAATVRRDRRSLLNHATLTYNLANRAIRVQDANQKITTTIYDAAGRTVGLSTPTAFVQAECMIRSVGLSRLWTRTDIAPVPSTTLVVGKRNLSMHLVDARPSDLTGRTVRRC